MKLKNITKLIILISIACGVTGCGHNTKLPKEANKTVIHKEMSEQIKKENGVADAKVELKNAEVVANVKVNDNLPQEKSKEMANRYANELKKQYEKVQITVNISKENKKNDPMNKPIKEQIPAKDNEIAGQATNFLGVEYVEINLRGLKESDIKKVILNGKDLSKEKYDIDNEELSIIKANKKSSIKVITNKGEYNVVFLN